MRHYGQCEPFFPASLSFALSLELAAFAVFYLLPPPRYFFSISVLLGLQAAQLTL